MTRAVVTSYHNYSFGLGTDYHRILYDYFVHQFPLWGDAVNRVYIIDTNWNFSEADKQRLWSIKSDVVFYKSPLDGHHCRQYQEFLPQVSEDEILFMDNDVFIHSQEGIEKWFTLAEGKDAVFTFAPDATYPPHSLKSQIDKKYPRLLNKPTYIDSAHFLLTRRLLSGSGKVDFMNYQPFPVGTFIPELDYVTQEGDWCEMFVPYWLKILARDSWEEMPPQSEFTHVRSCSYAYLLLAWKFLNLPQFTSELVKKFSLQLEWYKKIDTEGKYHAEINNLLDSI